MSKRFEFGRLEVFGETSTSRIISLQYVQIREVLGRYI